MSTLSEYAFVFVLLCLIKKLCVEKKRIPHSIYRDFAVVYIISINNKYELKF